MSFKVLYNQTMLGFCDFPLQVLPAQATVSPGPVVVFPECPGEGSGAHRGWGAAPHSPAERPEPGQVIGMVHIVANGDDLMETFDLDTHHLHRKDIQAF